MVSMVNLVKEKTVSFRDLPVLKCDFSWDTDALQARIKAYKPDYDPKTRGHDLTWPPHSIQAIMSTDLI
ncbi:hypothetical protein E8E12_005315 [Didymella heteroderae]|uniref:Uncharacterized protein n=1 Tax=Didymella heteroderae TaxID=1769908 RepID=A0A9P4WP66_9PLEO|nr:hypothetical protein E8E12_005315 [Didymella heteroderae]